MLAYVITKRGSLKSFFIWFNSIGTLASIVGFFSINYVNLKSSLIELSKNIDNSYLLIILNYIITKVNENLFLYSLIFFLILYLLTFFIIICRRYKVISSNCCKKLNIFRLIKIFNITKSFKLVKLLHELEHIFIEHEKIYKINNCYNSNLETNSLKEILDKYKEIFDLFSHDVSINIKIFFEKDKLKTFIRVPSEYEIKKQDLHELQERNRTEEFKIENITIVKQIEKIEISQKYNQNRKYSINSAYNNVVFEQNNERYWICNNLKKATKNKLFISSSKNYSNYYNSLAVFLISDKVDKIETGHMKGLLIIDSYSKGNFENSYIKQLGGYLAHKLYNFIRLNDIKMC